MVMEFQTQKELLEYLGKNPNDRNLVKRMMRNGEVDYHDGMWYLIDKDLMIKELQEKVWELQEKIEWYKVENNKMNNIVAEMEESLEKRWDNTDIVNKVYKYLTQVLHLRIDKSDFIEWLDNN